MHHTCAAATNDCYEAAEVDRRLPHMRVLALGGARGAVSLSLALMLAVAGCKREAEPARVQQGAPLASPTPTALPATPPVAVAPAAAPLGITWTDPSAWQRIPVQNPMRKASYRVPRASGDAEDGELAVFYFGPSEGGSIEANVQRWVRQFADVPADKVRRSERTQNGLRQHTVEIDSGTFSSGMPGGPTQPKTGYGLMGGIVESPSGAYFFKLTGPSATVKAAKASFTGLLDSVKVSQ